MRSSKKRLNPKLKKNLLESFYQLLSALDDKQEVEKFLDSFFTKAELLNFSKRLAIIQMLEKEVPYGEIKKKLKVSSATIAVVAESIQKKPQGLTIALKKMQAEAWASKTAKQITNFLKI